MSNRLTSAILLLYPRRVREGHGPEIVALIDDLIAHEGRSRTGLCIRLAVDGLVQRLASTATVWTVVAVLAATTFGGLAVSDLAAASAFQGLPRTVHTVAPARHMHRTPHHRPAGTALDAGRRGDRPGGRRSQDGLRTLLRRH
jgi:hypothetical protein